MENTGHAGGLSDSVLQLDEIIPLLRQKGWTCWPVQPQPANQQQSYIQNITGIEWNTLQKDVTAQQDVWMPTWDTPRPAETGGKHDLFVTGVSPSFLYLFFTF